jgi:hypothetical protein
MDMPMLYHTCQSGFIYEMPDKRITGRVVWADGKTHFTGPYFPLLERVYRDCIAGAARA